MTCSIMRRQADARDVSIDHLSSWSSFVPYHIARNQLHTALVRPLTLQLDLTQKEINPNARCVIAAGQHHGLHGEGCRIDQWCKRELIGEREDIRDTIHVDTEPDVDISGQARFAV